MDNGFIGFFRNRVQVLLLVIFVLNLGGCGSDSDGDGTKVSVNGQFESHNVGLNCMSCHTSGGSGESVFSAAGTVYDGSNPTLVKPNGVMRLYSEPMGGGTLIAELEVDGKGNFFTTNAIDWGTGLYAMVQSDTDSQFMISALTIGACNDCHSPNGITSVIFLN